jgi:hypothetical protein
LHRGRSTARCRTDSSNVRVSGIVVSRVGECPPASWRGRFLWVSARTVPGVAGVKSVTPFGLGEELVGGLGPPTGRKIQERRAGLPARAVTPYVWTKTVDELLATLAAAVHEPLTENVIVRLTQKAIIPTG